jgi:hypothetical protein
MVKFRIRINEVRTSVRNGRLFGFYVAGGLIMMYCF